MCSGGETGLRPGRYDQIVEMIQRSEQMKSGAEAKASSLADKLVPYTFAGSLLSLVLTRNVTRALSVLMVDFSCALKLAMPLAVLSAHAGGRAGTHHRQGRQVPGGSGQSGRHRL